MKTKSTRPEAEILRQLAAHPDPKFRALAARLSRIPGWTAQELAAELRSMMNKPAA
jgi:hypothetical protein